MWNPPGEAHAPKKKNFDAKRNQIIEQELNKLLDTWYVVKVQFTNWLSNVVVVPTSGGK